MNKVTQKIKPKGLQISQMKRKPMTVLSPQICRFNLLVAYDIDVVNCNQQFIFYWDKNRMK